MNEEDFYRVRRSDLRRIALAYVILAVVTALAFIGYVQQRDDIRDIILELESVDEHQNATDQQLKEADARAAEERDQLADQLRRLEDIEQLVGPRGPFGPRGLRGIAGERGRQGPAGPQGEPGPAGATGATGARGAQGERGATGQRGAQGERGAVGPAGPAGPPGGGIVCPPGSTFQTVFLNMPGGQRRVAVCLFE